MFEIPTHWEKLTMGEVCTRGGGGIQTGPFGSQLHAADYVTFGIPSIMPQNIGDNQISEEGIARISEKDAERLSRYLVKEGDIVYSRRGDVERRALIREKEDGWLCGTGCLRVRFGDGVVEPDFAAHYLAHPKVRAWIVRHAVGATMPNLNTGILSSLPFVLPPLPEQKAIAEVLGSLDDKIAANRAANATLETLARALFRSWFVTFEPTRARSQGKAPAHLSPEIAVLFPDEFEDSVLGPIPKGWRVGKIGDEVRVVGGGTPSTKQPEFWNDGEFAWASPKDLSGLGSLVLTRTERKITRKGLDSISSGLLPIGTVLLSSRAPIGYLALAQIPVAINQGFIAMSCEQQLNKFYVLFWAKENMDSITARANGTTFMEVSKSNFRPILVLLPSAQCLIEFENQLAPIFDQITANLEENRALSSMRDALLPLLLSGKLRVRN